MPLPPGIRTSKGEHIAGWFSYWVEHHHATAFTKDDLYHGAATALRVMVPGIPKSGDADDRVADVSPVECMLGS